MSILAESPKALDRAYDADATALSISLLRLVGVLVETGAATD